MDLALAIEALVPSAQYFGSTTDNSEACFDELKWEDERLKPTWAEIKSIASKVEAELTAKVEAKTALLERLGITEDEAKLLLG